MRKKYLLGVDVGTSATKGTLTDLCGNVLSVASREHEIISPAPGFAEHDPIGEWLEDFTSICHDLLNQIHGSAEEIACIGISTIMAAVTIVDEQCKPLRNAILYGIDTRCTQQVKKLNEDIGVSTWRKRYGTECTIEHFGPKLLWIKENEPELFAKAKHVTFASGFLTARLTGNFYVDRYSASSALPMFDPQKQDWDDDMCKYVCPKEMLPHVANSTYSIIGRVTRKASVETGLCEGTPVICGTTDAGAEAVSVGVVNPGDTMLMYGSTAFYSHVTDKSVTDSSLWGTGFTIDNRYAYTGGMATTGSLTKWIKNQLAKDLVIKERNAGIDAYQELFQEAESIPPGSNGLIVLPYFQGERMPIMDPFAKGVFFGLNLSHTRGHLVHAALEGVGFGIDQNLALLRKAGFCIDTVTAVGGGTKCKLWLQIVSDICDITQQVPKITIGASYGDALLAGLAVGSIRSPDDIKKLVTTHYIVSPRNENKETYMHLKTIYRELYERNKDIMHELW